MTHILVLMTIVHGQILSKAASLVRVQAADLPYFLAAAAWYIVEPRVQQCH